MNLAILTLVLSFFFLFPLSSGFAAEPPSELHDLRLKDPQAVASAVDRFRRAPDPRRISQLIGLLSDPNPLVRREGARALGVLRRPAAGRALQRLLQQDSDPEVRAQAALSLKEQGVEAPLHALEKEYSERLSDLTEEKRVGILRGLVRLNGPHAVAALRKILKQPQEELSLRLEAVNGLSALKDRSLFGELLTLLRSRSQGERVVAVSGLGLIGDRRAVSFLLGKVSDDSPEVRKASARVLGQLGDRRASPSLRRLLARDQDADVRREAALALARVRETEALDEIHARLWRQGNLIDKQWALRAWMESDDPKVFPWMEEGILDRQIPLETREALLRRLVTAGRESEKPFFDRLAAQSQAEPSLKEMVMGLLQGSSGEQAPSSSPRVAKELSSRAMDQTESASSAAVSSDAATLRGELADGAEEGRRLAALRELARRNDPSLPTETQILLKSQEPLSRRLALWSLRETDDPRLETQLLASLLDPDGSVRALAVRFLGDRSLPHGNSELLKRVTDPDPRVRIELAHILARGPLSDELLVLAQDPDPSLRVEVLHALAGRRDEGLFPVLVRLSRDEEAAVRAQALVDLEGFRDPVLAGLYLQRLSDPDEAVRMAAVEGSEGLLQGEEVARLYPLLSDPFPGVRQRAAQALGRSKRPDAIPILRKYLKSGPGDRVIEDALAELQGALLFPATPGRAFASAGFVRTLDGSAFLLYRGPLFPLFLWDPRENRWTPLPEDSAIFGSLASSGPPPVQIEGNALILHRQPEGERRIVLPETPGPVAVDGGRIWWGGPGGLGFIDEAEGRPLYFHPRALDEAEVTALAPDGAQVWVGWRREGDPPVRGLLRFDPRSGEEQVYDSEDSGILNEEIRSILPQGERVWLLQRTGVIRLDLPTQEGELVRFIDQGGEFQVQRAALFPMDLPGLRPVEKWGEEMQSPDAARRREAIRRLGFLRDPEAIPLLLERLEAGDPTEGVEIARSLARIGSPMASGPLLDRLMLSPLDQIPSYLRIVGETGRFARCGERCPNPERPSSASETPGSSDPAGARGNSVVSSLGPIFHFLDDARPEVVAAALAALADIGDRRSLPLIASLLASPEPRIAEAADESIRAFLARYGEMIGQPLKIEGILEGMVGRMRGERADAASLRSDLAAVDLRLVLASLYRLDAPGYPLPAGLGRQLVRFLGTEDPDVRWGAILLLGKSGDEAAALLSPLLDHPRDEIRRDAIRALSRISGPARSAVPDQLMHRLQRESVPSLREEILVALSPFSGEERWREKIRSVLLGTFRFDAQPSLRRRALLLLAGMGAALPWRDLEGGLKVHELRLRAQIVQEVLKDLDGEKGFPTSTGTDPPLARLIQEILGERNGGTVLKEWILQLIRKARLRSEVATLESILPDQSVRLKVRIEETLGELGGEAEIRLLAQRAEVGDARERYASLMALKRLGHSLTPEEESWISVGPI